MILTNELQQVLHNVGKQNISNGIQYKYTQGYSRRIIQRVNKEEEEAEQQKPKNEDIYDKIFGSKPQEGKVQ